MALGRKKLDDKILKTLREQVSIGGNKECFDCGQKGPTYVNMTIGSFVCTSCSGILRGLTPPHRVKSISMATFTQEEIEFLKLNGNENCSRTWLGLWDAKRTIKQEHRDFMMDKYERKRYYLEPASPLKSLQTNTSSSLTSLTMKNVNENLIPLKTPTLTPPTSLRLHRNNSSSCNGLNSVISSSTSTGSGHGIASAAQLQQQFTPDDSDFFGTRSPKILPPNNQKSSNLQRKNGIKIKKPVYEQPPTFERNQKNGLLSTSTSSNGNSGEYHGSTGDINANKFTPNSDFVADFGSASIINNANNDKNHYGSANSLKESGTTGLEIAIQHPHHGKSPDDDLENFADFDHNPIFNSAETMKSYSCFNSIDSITTTNSVSSIASIQSMSGPNPLSSFSYSIDQTDFSRSSYNASSNDTTTDSPDLSLGIMSPRHATKYRCLSPIDDSIQLSKDTIYEFRKKHEFTNSHKTLNSCYNDQPDCKYRVMNTGVDSNASHNNSNNNNNNCNGTAPFDNIQWSFWQHFDSHSSSGCNRRQQEQQQHNVNNNIMACPMTSRHVDSQITFCSDQNRWSLPVSALFKASSSSSTNNASVSSAPTVDRYAALKDLDEQFREFKLDTDSKKISTLASNGLEILNSKSDHHSHSTVNPFKPPNPFQQQQEQHEQRQMINWSIATGNGTESRYTSTACSENRFYANSQYTSLAQGGTTNMYNGNITTGVAGVIPVGYHTLPSYSGNGYSVVGSNGTLMSAYNTTSSSGGQQLVSNMPAQNVGNPFMVTGTSTRKSNNPFL